MQAADNYSDFVEERSAGVIVVLAEQRERRERRTALSLSHATELLTNTPASVHVRIHTPTHTEIQYWLKMRAMHTCTQAYKQIHTYKTHN